MSATTRTPETPVSTDTGLDAEFGRQSWRGGVIAGLGAGLVMAALMAFQMPGMFETTIPALYGMEGEFIGLFAHLSHSAVFGVLFAAIVVFGGLRRFASEPVPAVALGLAFGLALWIVGAGLVLPVWLDAVGAASVPGILELDMMSGLAHVIFGIVLGAAFAYTNRR